MEPESTEPADNRISVQKKAPALSPGARWFPLLWLQLVGLLTICFILAIASRSLEVSPQWFIPTTFGFYYGQIVLAAVLTVFGPWHGLIRITIPPLLVAAQASVAFLFIDGGPTAADHVLFSGVTIVFCFLAQVPFWYTRYQLAVRLVPVDRALKQTSPGGQFNLKHLLIFTLVVAVFLGLGRAFVSRRELENFFFLGPREVTAIVLLIAGSVTVGLVVVHFGLQRRVNVGSAVAALGCIVMAAIMVRYALMQVFPTDPEVPEIFSNAVVVQGGWLALNIVALRIGRWRLLRA